MIQNKEVLLLAPPNYGAGELLAFLETSVRKGGISYPRSLELTCRYVGGETGTNGINEEPDFDIDATPEEYQGQRSTANEGVSENTTHIFEITRSKRNQLTVGKSIERINLSVLQFPVTESNLVEQIKNKDQIEAIIILWPVFIREATSAYNPNKLWAENINKLLSDLPSHIQNVIFGLTHFEQAMLALEASHETNYTDINGHAALNPIQSKRIIERTVKNSSRLRLMIQTVNNIKIKSYVIPISLSGIIIGTNETNYYPSGGSDYLFDPTKNSLLARLARRYKDEELRLNDYAQWWIPIHIADPFLYVCIRELHEHFYAISQFVENESWG